MKVNQLSALKIKSISTAGYHLDGSGLYLKVTPAGTKSWIFKYALNKKTVEMGLGSIDDVGLAEARETVQSYRKMLLRGIDPKADRSSQRHLRNAQQSQTFEKCASAFIESKRSGWSNTKHTDQWTNTLTAYAYPVMGQLAPSDITVGHLMQILSPIWSTKHVTATRVRSRIEQVLDYARVMGYSSGENPARYQGNLKTLLPAVTKRDISKHFDSMPFEQVPDFMIRLRQMSGIAAQALQFTILTAARSGETRGAKWEEIQGDKWVVPASRMKAGIEHHVPLSQQAMAVLEHMRNGRTSPTGLIFCGSAQDKVMSDSTMSAVLKRMSVKEVTVHGFRSSFRIWCSESSARSFGDRAAEFALAHGLQSKVEASYQRSTLFDIRVQLMQAWSDYCDIVVKSEGATITDIKAKVAA